MPTDEPFLTLKSQPLHELAFAVVDVETTGTSPAHGDRITEIAIVTVGRGEITHVYEQLVNPGRFIPPMITALTHISDEMVRKAPVFPELAEGVRSTLMDKVFVAHNARFDWGFVSAELERADGFPLQGPSICTIRLSKALLPELPRRSLDSVTRYLGIEVSNRHRAAGDAVATAQLLLRLLDVAADRGVEQWEQLEALIAPRTRNRGRSRASRNTVTEDKSE